MYKEFKLPNVQATLEKLLVFAKDSTAAAIYSSNNAVGADVEIIAGFGVRNEIIGQNNATLNDLQKFLEKERDYHVFGYLGYDLKNQIEQLESNNLDNLGFPAFYFFEPQIYATYASGTLTIKSNKTIHLDAIERIIKARYTAFSTNDKGKELVARISKKHYLQDINKIQQHIAKGDIYELNYCQEFYNNNAKIDPYSTFLKLNNAAKAPFAAFLKMEDKFALSASPERYMKRTGNKIISQPIKGTAKRGKSAVGDRYLKRSLATSLKERTENVMIVDLVRNDMGRCAKPGSVIVDDLFKVYTFEHVHQMVSTISAELKDGISFTEIVKNTFPMGSMTGAPKVKMMQLAEEYETTKRGLYSGAIGYIEPNGNFDFNVVIRSLLYNATQKYLSCMVGGAITAASIPQKEYEECLVKLAGIQTVLKK